MSALDRNTFEAIEAYVLDRMPAKERALFEQRIVEDAMLREEVELERENIRAVELGGVTRVLREVAAEDRIAVEDRPGTWSRSLKYAAVVAVVAAGAIWWFTRAPLHERVFADHFTPDPGLPVEMSASNDPAFHDAMIAYKLADHKEALEKWAPLLKVDPANDTLRFYSANAALALGDAARAIPLFKALAAEPSSAFRDRSRWYLFLAHVRMGQLSEAEALGLDRDPVYGEQAKAIAAELGR
jgi:hypothetical protein